MARSPLDFAACPYKEFIWKGVRIRLDGAGPCMFRQALGEINNVVRYLISARSWILCYN